MSIPYGGISWRFQERGPVANRSFIFNPLSDSAIKVNKEQLAPNHTFTLSYWYFDSDLIFDKKVTLPCWNLERLKDKILKSKFKNGLLIFVS